MGLLRCGGWTRSIPLFNTRGIINELTDFTIKTTPIKITWWTAWGIQKSIKKFFKSNITRTIIKRSGNKSEISAFCTFQVEERNDESYFVFTSFYNKDMKAIEIIKFIRDVQKEYDNVGRLKNMKVKWF